MNKIYGDTEYSDICFKLDDGTIFHAHKVILAYSGSSYFRSMIYSKNFKESTSNIVELKDCSNSVFEIALKHAYGILVFKDKYNDIEDVRNIFAAASRFDCVNLVEVLSSKMVEYDEQLIFANVVLDYGEEFKHHLASKYLSIIDMTMDHQKLTQIINLMSVMPNVIEGFLYDCFKQQNLETINNDLIVACLKKVDYIKLMPDVSRYLAKHNYLPYQEVLKLLHFQDIHILEKYPLKVGILKTYKEYLAKLEDEMIGWTLQFTFRSRRIDGINKIETYYPECLKGLPEENLETMTFVIYEDF